MSSLRDERLIILELKKLPAAVDSVSSTAFRVEMLHSRATRIPESDESSHEAGGFGPRTFAKNVKALPQDLLRPLTISEIMSSISFSSNSGSKYILEVTE